MESIGLDAVLALSMFFKKKCVNITYEKIINPLNVFYALLLHFS